MNHSTYLGDKKHSYVGVCVRKKTICHLISST